jgi:hypothetical protein
MPLTSHARLVIRALLRRRRGVSDMHLLADTRLAGPELNRLLLGLENRGLLYTDVDARAGERLWWPSAASAHALDATDTPD